MRAILLVDSSGAFLGVMELLVRRLGYSARTARNAADCLRGLAAERADIVMTEVRLPDGSGTELCRTIRGNPATADTPVVMVTTDNSAATRSLAASSGCSGYITKPVTVRSVFDVLEGFRAGERRRKLRARMTIQAGVRVDGATYAMETLNFGEGGVFLRTARPRAVGEILDLSFDIPGRALPLELRGQVLFAFGEGVPGHPPGMGVKFLGLGAGEREFLAGFLEGALAGPGSHLAEHLLAPQPVAVCAAAVH